MEQERRKTDAFITRIEPRLEKFSVIQQRVLKDIEKLFVQHEVTDGDIVLIKEKINNGFGESIAQIRKMLWFVLSGLGTVTTGVILSIVLGG